MSKADIEYLLGSKTVVLDVPVQETLDIGSSSSIPIPLQRGSALPPLLNGNSIKTSLPLPGLTAPKLFSSAILEQFQTEETQEEEEQFMDDFFQSKLSNMSPPKLPPLMKKPVNILDLFEESSSDEEESGGMFYSHPNAVDSDDDRSDVDVISPSPPPGPKQPIEDLPIPSLGRRTLPTMKPVDLPPLHLPMRALPGIGSVTTHARGKDENMDDEEKDRTHLGLLPTPRPLPPPLLGMVIEESDSDGEETSANIPAPLPSVLEEDMAHVNEDSGQEMNPPIQSPPQLPYMDQDSEDDIFDDTTVLPSIRVAPTKLDIAALLEEESDEDEVMYPPVVSAAAEAMEQDSHNTFAHPPAALNIADMMEDDSDDDVVNPPAPSDVAETVDQDNGNEFVNPAAIQSSSSPEIFPSISLNHLEAAGPALPAIETLSYPVPRKPLNIMDMMEDSDEDDADGNPFPWTRNWDKLQKEIEYSGEKFVN